MAWELDLTGAVLEDLYVWIDNISLSKPKKKIERDFSDGILAGEIVRYYLPDIIHMNSYVPSSSLSQKKINWEMLNKKVFSQFGLIIPDAIIKDLSNGKPGTIEIFLFNLRLKIDEEIELRQKKESQATSSPRQSLLSLNNVNSTNDEKSLLSKRTSRTSRSIGNLRDKWVSRLDYEDVRQQCLQLDEELGILHIRMRRLEHVVQLKELRIAELTAMIDDYRQMKPYAKLMNKHKKK